MGCLEIKSVQTVFIDLVHLVVGAGEIPEFSYTVLGNRTVGLNAFNGIKNGKNTES